MTPAKKQPKDEPKRANNEGSVYFRKSDQRWVAALSVATADESKPRRVVRACKKDKNNKTAANVLLTEMKREFEATGVILTERQKVQAARVRALMEAAGWARSLAGATAQDAADHIEKKATEPPSG